MPEINHSRRQFVLKVAYTVPVVATLSVMPSLASAGSVRHDHQHAGGDCDDHKVSEHPQSQGGKHFEKVHFSRNEKPHFEKSHSSWHHDH